MPTRAKLPRHSATPPAPHVHDASDSETHPSLELTPELRAAARDSLVGLMKGHITFGAWLGLDAEDLKRLVELGRAKMSMGRHHEARRIFEGLTALEPEVAGFRLALALACEAEGAFDDAFEAYTEAIHLMSGDTEEEARSLRAAYVGRGALRVRKDDAAGALADFALARQHGGEDDPELSALLETMARRTAERYAGEVR